MVFEFQRHEASNRGLIREGFAQLARSRLQGVAYTDTCTVAPALLTGRIACWCSRVS
jgi:hypothetical protein